MKKQNKLLIILAFVFVGLVVCITALVVFIPILTNTKKITVPPVTNMTISEAIKKLQDEGFNVSDEQEEIPSQDVDEGLVVKTSPASGSKRKKGTIVKIYVSLGDTKIEIEDYTGKSFDEIKGKLNALGIKVLYDTKKVDEADAKNMEEGKIIDQSIKAGEKISVGEQITLFVPEIISYYPNFKEGDYTIDKIQDFANKYGLNVEFIDVETNEYEPGTIIEQSIPEGYQIREGQSFTIKVAKAPENNDDNCGGLC